MNLKKIIEKVFTSKFVGTGPSFYKKNNLPGRGLTKFEKNYFKLALYRVISVLLTVCRTDVIVNRLSISVAPYLVRRQLREL